MVIGLGRVTERLARDERPVDRALAPSRFSRKTAFLHVSHATPTPEPTL
jgi:hypothetical protein